MKIDQMKPERWRQIEQLYHAALKSDPGGRASFLAEACAGDDALRREVESLLRFDERGERFIEAPALEVAARLQAERQAQLLVGRTLGSYQLLALLGAGGMGEVYRARDTRLDREVAVKVLPAHLAQDPQALARFEREAKAVAALSHPCILAIHDFGTEQDVHFAVMELLEGETLRHHLMRSPLAWRKAVEIGAAIADGLSAAHAKGITHRDIKPENIFLTADGQVKILDFGIARVRPTPTSTTQPETTTVPGNVIGTVGYMSPEHLRGEKADAPSDIFSFGCVLHEMVTGCRAFARQTPAETIAAIMTDEPPPLVATVTQVPLELQRIVKRCLKKRSEERFQSARDLAFDLRAVLSGREIVSSGAKRQRLLSRPDRWMRSLALGVFLVLFAALAAVWWWQPWKKAASQPPEQRLISTFPGSHRAPSFSPDGQKVAFINAVDGVPQVWTKNLAQGDPSQITFGEVPADRPRWSPKDDQIAYVRHEANMGEGFSIWCVPPSGGTPRKLIDGGRNPNWSWDGHRLVFERGYDVWTAKADGSDQRRVEGIPPIDLLLFDRNPAFSPDGSLIAFFQPETPLGDIWLIPSAGGQAQRLTLDVSLAGGLTWTPNGRFIVFSSRRAGSLTLWRVPVRGGQPEPVLLGAGEDTDPEISRDGLRLIYTNTRNNFRLVTSDPVTAQTKEVLESRTPLVAPSFSPRGDRILFFHVTGDGIHLFTIGTGGGSLTQITEEKEEHASVPQWSADGSAIYYYQERPPKTSFRKVSVRSGKIIELAPGWTWETHNGAQVDPEGRRIIYSKLDKGIVAQTMIRDIETGKETAFTLPLHDPRWSSEGKFVVGVDVTSSKWPLGDITICTAEGEPCRKVTKGDYPNWSSDDSRIYFLRPGNLRDGRELWSISRDGGDERKVFDLRPDYHYQNFHDVSAAGQIVWVQFRKGKDELWLSDFPNP